MSSPTSSTMSTDGFQIDRTKIAGRLGKYNAAHRWEKNKLQNAICVVAGISICLFGYDQGLMGGVNTAKNYAELMGYGRWDEEENIVIVEKPMLQGSITAIFYLGTLIGCLAGGWFGDRYGRIKTIAWACVWSATTAGYKTAAMNPGMMYSARILNGLATGVLNAVTPVWVTETAAHTSRGKSVSIQFTLNILGVIIAYWLQFGLSRMEDQDNSVIWRFPIAFQIFPLTILFIVIWFMPESPRWLVKANREEEARYILHRLRGSAPEELKEAEVELQGIIATRDLELGSGKKKPASYFNMFFGIGAGKLHTARRVQLVIWLQIFQNWCGIAGITIYGPTIFTIAGISASDRLWISGLNNITYMFATLICVYTLDRIGRRMTLWWGSAAMAACMFAAGGLSKATLEASEGNKAGVGGAATFFVFLYTAIFGATWLTVPWLYPAEIFPLSIRAKGNSWGVVGWSIGNGWSVLLMPTIFDALGETTLHIFGAINVVAIPIVWAFYPESNQRTLEEMDLVFSEDSIWAWNAEKNFARLKAENVDVTRAAKAIETGMDDPEAATAAKHVQ